MEDRLLGGKIIEIEGEMSKGKKINYKEKTLNNEKICKNYRYWKLLTN